MNRKKNINHLMSKNEKEKAVRMYSEDVGMEFVIEKFEKRKTTRNRATKSRKKSEHPEKGNLQIFRNI